MSNELKKNIINILPNRENQQSDRKYKKYANLNSGVENMKTEMKNLPKR